MDGQSKWTAGWYENAEGCRYRYVTSDCGDLKPWMVFAHGVTDNWACVAPLADHFSDTYNILIFDEKAHGLSDAHNEGYDGKSRARNAANLCRNLGVEQPVLYGHSLGADTLARAADELDPRALILEDHPDQMFRSKDGNEHMRRQISQIMRWNTMSHRELREELSGEYTDTIATARKQVRPEAAKIGGHGYDPLDEVLEFAPFPTLLLRPDPDIVDYLDVERDKKWAKAAGPVEIEWVDGAGHTIFRDQPDQCRKRVCEFLKQYGLH